MKLLKGKALTRVCGSEIICLDINPTSKLLACSAYREPVKMIQFPYGKLVKNISYRKKIPVATGEDPKYILATQTGQMYKQAKVIEAKSASEEDVRYVKGPINTATNLCFVNQGKHLLVSYKTAELIVYDVKTGRPFKRFKTGGEVISYKILNKGRTILLSTDRWNILVLSINRWKITRTIDFKKKNLGMFAVSKDFKKVYFVVDKKHIQMLDFKNQTEFAYVKAHTSGINMIKLSPNGKVIASCGNDCKISLFDAETGRKIAYLVDHWDEVHSFVFSQSGRYIISSSEDNTLKVWDLKSLKLTEEILDVPNSFVMRLQGDLLILGTVKGEIRTFRVLENVK